MRPKIGILGGIGPESSAIFYEMLIRKVQSQGINSNTEYPHIILESISAPELLLQNPDLTMYKEAIVNLKTAGADFIVMVCNTAHIFLEQFKKIVDIPIIDLNKETEFFLKNRGINQITIFGSKKTVDNLFNFENITIEKIAVEESKILDNLILEYNIGKNKELIEKQLVDILKKYSGKNVLVACTELSIIFRNRSLKYLDTFDVLLDASLDKWNSLKLIS